MLSGSWQVFKLDIIRCVDPLQSCTESLVGPRQLKSRSGHYIICWMKCEVSVKSKSCLTWKGDSFSCFPSTTTFPLKKKQRKVVPYKNGQCGGPMTDMMFPKYFSAANTLLSSSLEGRSWRAKLTFASHPAQIQAALNSLAERPSSQLRDTLWYQHGV